MYHLQSSSSAQSKGRLFEDRAQIELSNMLTKDQTFPERGMLSCEFCGCKSSITTDALKLNPREQEAEGKGCKQCVL